uniref:PGG domain-containing protein n=1 Tax=Oryza nivara TaxID=4536 RepID=A0A0E0HP96_ORYNI
MANGHSTEDQEKVEEKPLELLLRKYLLLLAIMAATVTYATGFNPPGGVWQDTEAGHLAGDSIIRDTYYPRYLVFFYCNAAAFVLSIIVIILILSLAIAQEKKNFWIPMLPLRVAMVKDLLGLVGAYAAGTSRAVLKPRNAWVLAVIFVYMVIQLVLTSLSSCTGDGKKEEAKEQLQTADGKEEKINKLSQSVHPGGYWDSSKEGHNAGDLVMREHHAIRLKAFFVFNAAAFVMSLLIIMLLLDKQLVIPLLQDQDQSMTSRVRTRFLKAYIIIALVGLVGAYATGSSRNSDTTIYVGCLVFAVLACILFLKVIISPHPQGSASDSNGRPSNGVKKNASNGGVQTNTSNADILEKAQSLVVLLSTLVTTVTYQAGLIPPGGVWQENWKEHEAGNPILLSIQPERYKLFFYCNSIAFAVSLVIIILVQYKPILKHHILELAMIMDLFGLIGAYSAGSCRDVTTSIYVIALAGVVLVYVVIHVIFITLDEDMGKKDGDKDKKDEGKRRKRLLLFAVLCTTLTYQAGLTPPGGFWLKDDEFGHHAGNKPANSQDEEERVVQKSPPAQDEDVIEQETQTLKPSETMSADEIKEDDRTTKSADIENAGEAKNNTSNETNEKEKQERAATESNEKEDESKKHAKRKYFMLLGVLAASVTYQAGLNPPGGVWQGNSNGRAAGNPVMHDNKRYRYLIFFYSNSASFVASVVVIILLLKEKLLREDWLFKVMNITIVLNLLGLLLAYMAGSRMRLESSGYFIAFVIAALGIAAIHKIWSRNRESK